MWPIRSPLQIGCMPALFSGEALDPSSQLLEVVVPTPLDACSNFMEPEKIKGAAE